MLGEHRKASGASSLLGGKNTLFSRRKKGRSSDAVLMAFFPSPGENPLLLSASHGPI